MPTTRRPALSGLEMAALAHAGLYLAATTWAFGGNADWVRTPLNCFGSLGALITLAAAAGGEMATRAHRRFLRWLWPLGLLNGLVLASLLTPLFRKMALDGDTLLVPQSVSAWLPAAALPSAAARVLWQFDCAYLAGFNILLTVQRKRWLRALLLFAVGNAFVLAVFGTVQKLVRSDGIYFGRVKSPQVTFFASFVYHNHWGAFMLLMSSACLGLVWHYGNRAERGFLNSLGFFALVILLFLVATVPLCGSRACTLLLLLLLGGAAVSWMARLIRLRRVRQEPVAGAVVSASAALFLACAAVWALDREVILARVAKTSEQVADMHAAGGIGSRAVLYRDTWKMARGRLWLGWGAGSFPYVFMIYNTQEPDPRDHLPKFYHDAHSDWLQAAAEYGLIGSALLLLCAAVPWAGTWRHSRVGSIPRYLFIGCGLVLLYALVEFPFGNGAVELAWWIAFFSALAYARMEAIAA